MKNFKMLLCLTRSFDRYHVDAGLIHLIGTIFYTYQDISLARLDPLKDYSDLKFVIRVVGDSMEDQNNLFDLGPVCQVCTISQSEFIASYPTFFINLFGNLAISELEFSKWKKDINCLFIFEGLD